MKSIANLHDALIHLLRGLFEGENILRNALGALSKHVTSSELRNECKQYEEDTTDKILKLERIFNYLMTLPGGRHNDVMKRMIAEAHDLMNATTNESIMDVVLVSCIQSISNYKISGYQTALAITINNEVENIADLLQEILNQELRTEASLKRICKKMICGQTVV